jgi:hypothetical protein
VNPLDNGHELYYLTNAVRIKTNDELDKLIRHKNIINYIKAQRLILGNDQFDALFLNVFILRLYMCLPCRPAGTADSHSPECVIPDDVLIQFGPPDDEHLLLETCRGVK